MMQYLLYVIVGAVSGILGGMGMGGGTLLIPLLTIVLGFNQKMAQAINLISFSIMAIFVIFFHIKNKLVDIKTALGFALVATVTSVLGAILANSVSAGVLKIFFGILLIVLAVVEAICELYSIYKKNR